MMGMRLSSQKQVGVRHKDELNKFDSRESRMKAFNLDQ